jgi:hypothetical protein
MMLDEFKVVATARPRELRRCTLRKPDRDSSMRVVVVIVFVLLALNGCAGQRANATDKETILNLDRELTEALLSGRCDVFEGVLADDYSGTGTDGTARNKAQTIDSCKSLAALPESIRPKPSVTNDSEVRFYQNVAIQTGKRSSQQQLTTFSDLVDKHLPIKLVDEVRYISVWVKTSDHWQLVSAQATKLTPADRQ